MNYTRNYLNTDCSLGVALKLDTNSAHHLTKVLRKKKHDKIEIFDGKGSYSLAEITAINRTEVLLKVIKEKTHVPRKGINISLGQALIKPDPFNLSIQKATELGVKDIFPLQTERSVVRIDDSSLEKKHAKWSSIAQGACEQCGENWLPEIFYPMSLVEWATLQETRTKIVLYPGADTKISDLQYKDSISIAIGPEGGFSSSEVDTLIGCNFTPVTIGSRILRAETAVMAAMSSIRTLAEEF